MKKLWEKPKLVVLVRGKPEESVLAICKGGGFTPLSAKNAKGDCLVQEGKICPGTSCSEISST